MGLQGYSSPTEEHVIFCVAKELVGTFEAMREVVDFLRAGQSEQVRYYTGMYKGVLESAYVLPRAAFDEFARRWPQFLYDQESVLVLGTPRAMNHRPATLHYRDASIAPQSIGMFVETDRETALASVGYTHARMKDGTDKYWICVNNPADCVEEEKHRAYTDKLERVYDILNTYIAPSDLRDAVGVLRECLAGRRNTAGVVRFAEGPRT